MSQELKIKLSLDNAQPEQALDEFGKSADKATGRARDGMGRFTKGAQQAEQATGGLNQALGRTGSAIADLIKAQVGLGAVKGIAQGIGDEWKRAADEIGKASREWQAFRKSLSSVASLSGKPATNAFASAEIDAAEAAGVKPDDYRKLREAFLSKASRYVGEGPDAKLSEADALEVQKAMSALAQNKGISQEEMGGFAGQYLAGIKGKTNAADMKAGLGRVLSTLEASSTEVAQLLPQQVRLQAQGMGPEEAASLLAAAPEYAPGEEGTYILRALATVQELQNKGTGEEYGIKKGAGKNANLRALVGNLQKRQAAGEDIGKLLSEIAPEQISQRALQGMLEKGGVQNMDAWRRIAEQTPKDFVDAFNRDFQRTETGIQNTADSASAVAEARRGMRNDAIELRRQVAKTQLMNEGILDQPPSALEAASTGLFGWAGAGSVEEQRINRRVLSNARAELGESSGALDLDRSTGVGVTNELLRELIKRIEEGNEIAKAAGGGWMTQVPAAMPGRPSPQPRRP